MTKVTEKKKENNHSKQCTQQQQLNDRPLEISVHSNNGCKVFAPTDIADNVGRDLYGNQMARSTRIVGLYIATIVPGGCQCSCCCLTPKLISFY